MCVFWQALGKYQVTVNLISQAGLNKKVAMMFATEPGNGSLPHGRDAPYVKTYTSEQVGAGKTYNIEEKASRCGLETVCLA